MLLALKVKEDSSVSSKIKEIEAEISKAEANSEKLEKYNLLIREAEGLMASKKYTESKAKYNEAILVDPTQQLPKQKIIELDKLILQLQQQKNLENQIDKLMNEASILLTKKDYNNAKLKYEEILKKDPVNAVAPEKIKFINEQLNALK